MSETTIGVSNIETIQYSPMPQFRWIIIGDYEFNDESQVTDNALILVTPDAFGVRRSAYKKVKLQTRSPFMNLTSGERGWSDWEDIPFVEPDE